MNKNISQNFFPRSPLSLLLFYFWRQFFTSHETVSSVLFFLDPGSRIEYMHESPFHFLCSPCSPPPHFSLFLFCSKSHIIIRPLLLLLHYALCLWPCQPSASTARMNVKREPKEIYWRKFRFFIFVCSRISCLVSHCSLREALCHQIISHFFRSFVRSIVRWSFLFCDAESRRSSHYFIIIFFFSPIRHLYPNEDLSFCVFFVVALFGR